MGSGIARGIETAGAAFAGAETKRQESKEKDKKTLSSLKIYSDLSETVASALPEDQRNRLRPAYDAIGQAIADQAIDGTTGLSLLNTFVKMDREGKLQPLEERMKIAQATKAEQDVEEGEFEKKQRGLPVEKTREFESKMALEKAKTTASSKQKLLEGGINIENIDFDNPNDVSQAFKDLTLNEVEKDILKDEIKGSSKLFKGLKRFATAVDAFKRAMPAEVLPVVQRVRGPLLSFGASTGIVPNGELLALQNQIKSDAINFVKALGESGNLAQQEQQNAVDAISSANKTDEERNASVRIALEKGMSGYSTDALSVLLKDPSIVDMLVSFQVPIKNLKYMPERIKRQFAIATIRQKEALNG